MDVHRSEAQRTGNDVPTPMVGREHADTFDGNGWAVAHLTSLASPSTHNGKRDLRAHPPGGSATAWPHVRTGRCSEPIAGRVGPAAEPASGSVRPVVGDAEAGLIRGWQIGFPRAAHVDVARVVSPCVGHAALLRIAPHRPGLARLP